jgi:hypothetical protein
VSHATVYLVLCGATLIRHGEPPYLECSSRGDRRFSAFYAKLDGKSIEELYQRFKLFPDKDGKPFSYGNNWKSAKGNKAINQEEAASYYASLWDRYLDERPELLEVIKSASGLSDIFGQAGHVCQATELWRIKNA